METNLEIRAAIKNHSLFSWQLAQKLGIHENTFYRWMRTEMSIERKGRILAVISELSKEMQEEGEM